MKKQFYINQASHLNCSGRHHVAVCTFQNRDSGNPWQSPENHSTTSNLINVPKNDSIFLQVSSVDESNCQNLKYYLITDPSCHISAHKLLKI